MRESNESEIYIDKSYKFSMDISSSNQITSTETLYGNTTFITVLAAEDVHGCYTSTISISSLVLLDFSVKLKFQFTQFHVTSSFTEYFKVLLLSVKLHLCLHC